jgi:phage FluMu protein Com
MTSGARCKMIINEIKIKNEVGEIVNHSNVFQRQK